MKRLLPCIFLLILLSCSNDREAAELAFKKDVIKRNIYDNEQQYRETAQLSESGRHGDSFKAQSKNIVSWRRHFMEKPTRENLLLYADSVEARYNRSGGSERTGSSYIRFAIDQLEKFNDSLSFYNVLYYTTVAEGSLLKIMSQQAGITDFPYWYYYPLYLDKEEYELDDSVIVTLTPCHECLGDATLDFSQVTCMNEEKGSNLKPRILKSGPNYILIYNPDSPGTYNIRGKVILKQAGNYKTESGVKKDFFVNS